MKAELFRMRIDALWLAVAVSATASILLYVFTPGAAEELLAGRMEGEELTAATGWLFAAVVVIPLVMVVLTPFLRERAIRSVNLVVGIAYGLAIAFMVGMHLVDGVFNAHVLLGLIGCVFVLGIVGVCVNSFHEITVQERRHVSLAR
jgi:heme exporter protein D